MRFLTEISLRAPRTTIASLLGMTLLFAAGLPDVRTEVGYRPLLGGNHPSIRTLEGFIERFGGGLPIVIAWHCGPRDPCDSVFDAVSLRMADELAREVAAIPGVKQVDGPATTSLLVPAPGGFAVRRLIEDGAPVEDVAVLAREALSDPRWIDTLISRDGSVGAIHAVVTDSSSETSIAVVDALERALAPLEARGFTFHLIGHAVAFAVAGRELAENTAGLVPVTTLIICLVLFGLTRSWQATLLSLATLGVALVWTFGLVGWLSWPNDNILQVLAPLILVLGVCDTIHLLSRHAERLAGNTTGPAPSSNAAVILDSARDVGPACLVTTLTTAAALLSFATSDLQTFIRFGFIAAFGVMVCLLLTFTLLPILLLALPPSHTSATRSAEMWRPALSAIAAVSERRATPILLATSVLFVVFASGWIGYLRVDTSWAELFGEESRVIRWIRFVEQELGTLERLEIELALPESAPLEDPATLQQVDRFSRFVESIDPLGDATSIVELLQRLRAALGADGGSGEILVEGPEANAQLLELLAIQDPDLLDHWVSFDRRRVRVSVEAGSPPVGVRGEVLRQITTRASSELPEGWELTLTGPFAIGFDFVHDLQATQIRSFPVAFVLITLILALFLRSLPLALVGMVPTVLPAVVILGAMGFTGMSLDVGRAMIAAVLIGLAVDDSVHLLTQYQRGRARQMEPGAAMRRAVLRVGRPVTTTSLALGIGLLTFLASPWQTVSSFGFYMSVGILGALAADLLVLPALVMTLDRRERVLPDRAEKSPAGPKRIRETVLTVILVAPVATSLLIVGGSELAGGPGRELACWILPNGRAAPFPLLGDRCPLSPHDQVQGFRVGAEPVALDGSLEDLGSVLTASGGPVELAVAREGRREWHRIPEREISARSRLAGIAALTTVAGLLLFTPLLSVWRSTAGAVIPFSLFYAAITTVLVCALAGHGSIWLARIATTAVVILPATLIHLAFTFPRERRVIREVPALRGVPYGLAGFLLPAAWIALERDALLWPSIVYLLIALTAGAWLILLVSCGYAIRESTSALERARARVLCYGALLLPLPPALLLTRNVHGVEGGLLVYLGTAALTMPLPIGLAISRYNLFNLGVDARAWIARLIYLAVAASVVGGAFALASKWLEPVHSPVLLFAVAFAGVVAAEPIRRRLVQKLDTLLSPDVERLRGLREDFSRLVCELRDPDQIARLLAETLRSGLSSRAGCIFLPSGDAWRPAFGFGEPAPAAVALAEAASSVLGTRRVMDLGLRDEDASADEAVLRGARVQLVALLERRGERCGLVLLAHSESELPYNRLELDFIATSIEQATIAVYNARLAEDLIAAERQVTTGRIALALAHDVGKELDWLHRLVQRLPGRLADHGRASRDLQTIGKLTEDIVASIRGFVQDAREAAEMPAGRVELDHLITRAIRSVGRIHRSASVTRCVDPNARGLRVDPALERVLINLLDNAVRAAAGGESVHLFATADEGELVIAVSDRGSGMSEAVQQNAFRMGFTTRGSEGGSGVGLAVCREIVRAMRGTIDLVSDTETGTRVSVRVPMGRGSGHDG